MTASVQRPGGLAVAATARGWAGFHPQLGGGGCLDNRKAELTGPPKTDPGTSRRAEGGGCPRGQGGGSIVHASWTFWWQATVDKVSARTKYCSLSVEPLSPTPTSHPGFGGSIGAPPQGRLLSVGGGGGGGGFGTQKFVYQKWPDQIFPIVNFIFSHDGPFGRGGVG